MSWIRDTYAGIRHARRFFVQLLEVEDSHNELVDRVIELEKRLRFAELRIQSAEHSLNRQRVVDDIVVQRTRDHGIWS